MDNNQIINKPCLVENIVVAQKTSDGAGVTLKRSLGSHSLPELDPFLLIDEFRSDDPNEYIAGFPSHPHRGFETVTYMLAGKMEHKDSVGNTGIIKSGGVQWMTAGKGIIHSEMPVQVDGLMAGFQIWINLPANLKMTPPQYQNLESEQIPSKELENGIYLKVIAGLSNGVTGAVKGIATQPLFIDLHMGKRKKFDQNIQESHNNLIYPYEGQIIVKAPNGGSSTELHSGQLGVLSKGDTLSVETLESPARFILLSAKPLNEPIVRHGPFVMNSSKEIRQAIEDYQNGNFTD